MRALSSRLDAHETEFPRKYLDDAASRDVRPVPGRHGRAAVEGGRECFVGTTIRDVLRMARFEGDVTPCTSAYLMHRTQGASGGGAGAAALRLAQWRTTRIGRAMFHFSQWQPSLALAAVLPAPLVAKRNLKLVATLGSGVAAAITAWYTRAPELNAVWDKDWSDPQTAGGALQSVSRAGSLTLLTYPVPFPQSLLNTLGADSLKTAWWMMPVAIAAFVPEQLDLAAQAVADWTVEKLDQRPCPQWLILGTRPAFRTAAMLLMSLLPCIVVLDGWALLWRTPFFPTLAGAYVFVFMGGY